MQDDAVICKILEIYVATRSDMTFALSQLVESEAHDANYLDVYNRTDAGTGAAVFSSLRSLTEATYARIRKCEKI